jgi:hypothetical protein
MTTPKNGKAPEALERPEAQESRIHSAIVAALGGGIKASPITGETVSATDYLEFDGATGCTINEQRAGPPVPDPAIVSGWGAAGLLCAGIGQYHTNEPDPENPRKTLTPYQQKALAEIFAMVSNPPSVPKAEGEWIIASTLPSRNFAEQAAHGQYWLLWADLDQDPLPIAELERIVLDILGRSTAFAIYTSRSATAERPKARILIPLQSAIAFDVWWRLQRILNDRLHDAGAVPDRANERAAQLCYLPNKGEFYDCRARDGQGFDPAVWAGLIAEQQQAEGEAERDLVQQQDDARKRRQARQASGEPTVDVIGAFNRDYTVAEILLANGYAQRGMDFRHPRSESGGYSARIKDGRVFSLSPGDLLSTGQGGGAHDAFSVFCILEHGGDQRRAVRAAAEILGIAPERYDRIDLQGRWNDRNSAGQNDPWTQRKDDGQAGPGSGQTDAGQQGPGSGSDKAATRDSGAATGKGKPGPSNTEAQPVTLTDLSDLMNAEFEPIRYVCKPFVAEGYTVYAGKPKIGKTTLMRQLVIAAHNGGDFLGSQCVKTKCLFLSLEEGKRVFKEKVRRMGYDANDLKGITVAFEWQRGMAAIVQLREYLQANPQTKLIVIDSLSAIKPTRPISSDPFQADYIPGSWLQQVAKDHPGLAIIVIHHTRKMDSVDPLDLVSGTNGVTAAADSICVLHKTVSCYAMHFAGRLWMLDESDYEVRRENNRWACVRLVPEGLASLPANATGQDRILRLLLDRGEMTQVSISRDLGLATSTVSAAIKALTSRRAVKRGETGYVAVR